MKKLLILAGAFLIFFNASAQKFEELAKTPQMGWNSWNTFALEVNEQLVKGVADAFVTLGLKDAGYEYIVLDDGWMAMERDAQGNLVPHPEKFPNGIKALADYVHSKGLKFGVYGCAGDTTCGKFPGNRGHEYQDALKYAEWGVDYLKYDWCTAQKLNAEQAYITMRDALYTAGRPVLFSICEWGENNPWKWGAPVGHSWRVYYDIYDCFDCVYRHPEVEDPWDSFGVIQIANMKSQDSLRIAAGPGHWNDLDMLEVGVHGLDLYENQSHFALWAILSSPLILGNDVRSMSKETLEILTNKDIIAVNQDTLGIQGFKYKTIDSVEVWVKPLANNEWAFCFVSRSATPVDFSFDWNAEKIIDNLFHKEVSFSKDNIYKIKDLYAKKEIGTTKKPLTKKLAKHQSLVIRLTK